MTPERRPPDARILRPPGWAQPRGYADGVQARGRVVFLAGMVGWNPATQRFETDDFVLQARQALENVVTVLREAGGRPEHLARLTWFVGSRREYQASLAPLGAAYRAVIGGHYPAMSVLEVSGFIEEGAKLEIEATAVIPD